MYVGLLVSSAYRVGDVQPARTRGGPVALLHGHVTLGNQHGGELVNDRGRGQDSQQLLPHDDL